MAAPARPRARVQVRTAALLDELVLTCRAASCVEQWTPAPIGDDSGDGVVQLSLERCPACGSSTWEVTQVQVAALSLPRPPPTGPHPPEQPVMTTTRTLDRTRPPAAGHRRPWGFVGRWRARRAERDAWAAHHRFAQGVTAEFREACTALRLCQYVSVAAGVTVRTPRVGAVHGGRPCH